MIGCQQRIVVSDDFTQPDVRKWWMEEDGFGRTFVANGQMIIEVNQANAMQYATLREIDLADFAVTVDTTLLEGSPKSSHGIIVRSQPAGGFYRFAIVGDGTWSVDRHDAAGNWLRLTPGGRWAPSDAINQGLGATNRLRVTARGATVAFEINDQRVFVSETFDSAFLNGNIALSSGTFAQPGTRVAFDNFVIREPQ